MKSLQKKLTSYIPTALAIAGLLTLAAIIPVGVQAKEKNNPNKKFAGKHIFKGSIAISTAQAQIEVGNEGDENASKEDQEKGKPEKKNGSTGASAGLKMQLPMPDQLDQVEGKEGKENSIAEPTTDQPATTDPEPTTQPKSTTVAEPAKQTTPTQPASANPNPQTVAMNFSAPAMIQNALEQITTDLPDIPSKPVIEAISGYAAYSDYYSWKRLNPQTTKYLYVLALLLGALGLFMASGGFKSAASATKKFRAWRPESFGWQ